MTESFTVHQKLTQQCKSTIPQLKKSFKCRMNNIIHTNGIFKGYITFFLTDFIVSEM